MAKTSRPDRKKNDRRSKEPKEYEETTLSVDRVTRVVGGGRRLRFRAVVVIGNKKGKVGLGTGKANDVQAAVQKATADAKRNMIRVPLVDGTLPHEIDTKFKAARIRLIPASDGTGIIAGGALRVVLDHAGVKNVLSKRYGTTNKLVNAQCVLMALSSLRGDLPDEDAVGGASAPQSKGDQPEGDGGDDEELETPEGIEIKEVSSSDVEEGSLKAT